MQAEIYNLWRELNPLSAFIDGDDFGRDKVYVPSDENIRKAAAMIGELKKRNSNKEYDFFLDNFRTSITALEPQSIIHSIVAGLFLYRVKKADYGRYLKNSVKVIEALKKDEKEYCFGVNILTLKALNDLEDILKNFKIKSNELNKLIADLREKYRIGNLEKLDFNELFKVFYNKKHFKRDNYEDIVSNIYGFENVREVEKVNFSRLNKHILHFRKLVKLMEAKYGVKGAEKIEEKLVGKDNLIKIVEMMNENASKLVDKYLLAIPKNHDIRIMETPAYLRSSIPEAAIYALDTFKKPYSLLFVTPSKHASKPALLNTLVHENHGHCLNYTYLKCSRLRKISTGFSLTISDGLSVAMEYQLHDLIKKLGDKEVSFMKDFMGEFDFAMEMRKLIIPLRAVCDIRVNSGKQSLSGFVDEMNEVSGIGKEHLFNILLPRQFDPGYAVVYGTMGIKILDLMKESMLSQKQFNAKAYSLGFPHRSVFEGELS